MSWNGTVYCGHCGEKGHNRRGCKKLEELHRLNLEDPDSGTYARYCAERFFKKKQDAKKRAQYRKCSYCGMIGHNRKTCKVLKHDIDRISSETSRYVKLFMSLCQT